MIFLFVLPHFCFHMCFSLHIFCFFPLISDVFYPNFLSTSSAFSVLCLPPRIPAFLAFYCSIGGEVLTGKLLLESCSGLVPWLSMIRRVIK